MTKLHQKRFDELSTQLADLESSETQQYDIEVGRNKDLIDYNALLEWKVKVRNLLSRVCGPESQHLQQFEKNEIGYCDTSYDTLLALKAVLVAAKEDFEGGYLSTTRLLVQAEVFDNELEQARELQSNGFTTAAAVIAGVVLETALRELCDRESLSHGRLDKMNADLAKASVFNKLQQKRITALADIRNSAAHGKPTEFSSADVDDMIRDVERFVADHLTTT
ncbi:DUF4145 domain-containing protein [Rosistilla oblonga]|uniref:DUF4145 domain-containing protein n=1 Tax=Rosistilla oblonga TaxID=2527990 RepID=A0A518IUK6_9BACT|nr:DUF4145 domain-containing protein [Rosistilla oblonga]QDV56772.1 hypothetical protein Mal33_27710 [Rosistilla oblonga]